MTTSTEPHSVEDPRAAAFLLDPYRLKHAALFVPLEATALVSLEEFLRAKLEPRFQQQIEAEARLLRLDSPEARWGQLLHRNAHGNIDLDMVAMPLPGRRVPSPEKMRSWGVIRTTPEHAASLVQRFRAIYDEVAALPGDGPTVRPYLLQMALLPLEEG